MQQPKGGQRLTTSVEHIDGSGKTLTSREEFYKHMIITPNGNTVIGANVASQYEQTIKRDIEADLPMAFVARINTQKQYVDFINGHRLMYRPFDDPEKLRSYNITMFIIIEASEVKQGAFTQLKTRLRNLAATVPKRDANGNIMYKTARNGVKIPLIDHDWFRGIIESNPSAGWIRSDLLMYSDEIHKHGKINDVYGVIKAEQDPDISSHVTATDANEFLPNGFIESNIKNKPYWWVQRYIYGSFQYAEGLVYPSAIKHIVETFDIPKHWKRIVAYDYGLSDDSVYIFGAVDELHNLLYIYKEVRDNNKSVEFLAKLFHQETQDIAVGNWICPPIIDPKSGPKRDYDKKSLSDHFLEYGIAFKPGHINVDARVYRLNTYLESGKCKIMDCCEALVRELRDYKFVSNENTTSGRGDKPEDKNNHGINALEWIVMELPADPSNLIRGVYDKMGKSLTDEQETDIELSYAMYALSDPSDYQDKDETPFDSINYFFS